MISLALSVTVPFFVTGALLLSCVQPRDTDEKRRIWLKFLVYVVIVEGVVVASSLGTRALFALFSVISFLAAVELASALSRAPGRLAFQALCWFGFVAIAGGTAVAITSLSAAMVLFLYLVVAAFDGFSEAVGRNLGRAKLSPTISPRKTCEGALGGAVGGLLIAIAAGPLTGLSTPRVVQLATGICCAALMGDLAASWIKRQVAIKDFGRILPGHGGVLDRFDSFLGAAGMAGCLQWLISESGALS